MIVLEMSRDYRNRYAKIRETIGLDMGKVVGVRVGYGKSREITLMAQENVARVRVWYRKKVMKVGLGYGVVNGKMPRV